MECPYWNLAKLCDCGCFYVRRKNVTQWWCQCRVTLSRYTW